MSSALYGPAGFYVRGDSPALHFRTSVHTSPRFAHALVHLLCEVDGALGHPDPLDVVDVGAGRGELLTQMLNAVGHDGGLARRVRACAVEVTARPREADRRIMWRGPPPDRITGLVIANEWLDNIPLDVAELTADGPRLMLVDPGSGEEKPGPRPCLADLRWLGTWWPLRSPGARAEIGQPRSRAWARVISRLERGLAVAIDYCHEKSGRPDRGTLAAYQFGRAVRLIPDGSRDITAHVALDACAQAGIRAGASESVLTTQRAALRALGVTGRRPDLALAPGDPLGYARDLASASQDAELVDPAGLGAFGWLVQTVGMAVPGPLAGLARAPEPAAAGR